MNKTNIFVTGASGFVGSHLVKTLAKMPEFFVQGSVRGDASELGFPKSVKIMSGIRSFYQSDLQPILSEVDCVVHCAARVHIMNDREIDPLSEFRKVNVQGTMDMMRAASKAGIKRFIFLSSLKVNGENTVLNKPYCVYDKPNPLDPYGISKMEAENHLQHFAREHNMDLIIIRPPLVYGPGVQANFLSMMKWLDKRLPLPFGCTNNKRSFVALENLVDLIIKCSRFPGVKNNIFLVSDDHDMSTTNLLNFMGKALGKRPLLWPVPPFMLKNLLHMINKPSLSEKLLGNLQADISETKKILGWQPVISVEKALQETATYYLEKKKGESK